MISLRLVVDRNTVVSAALRPSVSVWDLIRCASGGANRAQTPWKSAKDWWPISTRAKTWSGSTLNTLPRGLNLKTLEAESLPAAKMRIA
jgi:hypothetical protein